MTKDVVPRNNKVTEKTTYYTSRGKQDYFDEEEYPIQENKDNDTLAICTGERRLIRIDDMGHFIHPWGLYPQKTALDRWAPVNKKCFQDYINFLKTKKQIYLTSAIREAT